MRLVEKAEMAYGSLHKVNGLFLAQQRKRLTL